jgi:hypothetical protein
MTAARLYLKLFVYIHRARVKMRKKSKCDDVWIVSLRDSAISMQRHVDMQWEVVHCNDNRKSCRAWIIAARILFDFH